MNEHVKKIIEEGIDSKGFISEDVLKIIKHTTPVFCVDAIIVPESDGPSAILFKRSDIEATSCGKYWIVGGRQRLGEPMEKTVMRKIKQETGLSIEIKPEDQLFAMDVFHKIENGKISPPFYDEADLPQDRRELYYHTPAVCYLAKAPPFEQIKNKIKAGDGHDSFKLYTNIDSSLDKYIKRAMSKAWKRIGYKF